jgi:membrane-bound metal-dependent hydrolase YbcI (DUF457 family)
VLLWFVGVGVLMVWVVFQSPALDVRMVAVGLLLPWLDGLTGGPFVLHTLAGSVGLLALVMLLTRHSRVARRVWLGLPIGTFLHLTLDAAWTRTALFWWPFAGEGAFDGPLPELDRSLGLLFVMELAGAAALWWAWQAFGLGDPDRREELRASGRLRPRS